MTTARTAALAAIAAVAGAGGLVATVIRRRKLHFPGSALVGQREHWLAVTVNRSPDEIGSVASLPEPLARLRDGIEVRILPAAGDKGTELRARPSSDEVSREQVRLALRQAKSLLETGEVLEPDTAPSTHAGLGGKVLQLVTAKSKGEGRL